MIGWNALEDLQDLHKSSRSLTNSDTGESGEPHLSAGVRWMREQTRWKALRIHRNPAPTVVHRQVRHDETLSLGRLIACTGWIDENGQANQLLLLSVGGTMTEYWLHDRTWSQTATSFQ